MSATIEVVRAASPPWLEPRSRRAATRVLHLARRSAGLVAQRRVRAGRPARRRGARRDRALRRVRAGARLARSDRSTSSRRWRRTSTRRAARSTRKRSSASCAPTPTPAPRRGITPCIENVPPVLRMRTGGVFLSPIGGHWRDLLAWQERIPELRFTLDTSHAALFRNFAEAYGSLFGVGDPTELALDRYVEELGHAHERGARLRCARPARRGPPVRQRRARPRPRRRAARRARFRTSSPRSTSPIPPARPTMKSAYHAIERALAVPAPAATRPARRLPPDTFDWQAVLARRDPVPSVLELQELFGGRRVLVTGGAGSIGRALCSFLLGFRPERVTVARHERGGAHRRPPCTRRRRRSPSCATCSATSATAAASSASSPPRGPTSSSTLPPTSTWTGPRASRRSSSTRT